MKRQRLGLVLALLLCVGCPQERPSEESPRKLKVLIGSTYKEHIKALLASDVREFTFAFDDIEWVDMPGYPGRDAVFATSLAARFGDVDPDADVFFIDLYRVGSFRSSWLTRYDATDSSITPSHYRPAFLRAAQINEEGMYAVPWSAKGNFLFYRKDLVPEPPRTWEELRQSCEQLSSRVVQGERLRYCVLINWFALENDLYPTLWGLQEDSDPNDAADSALHFSLSSDASIRFLSELASMMGQEVHAGFLMMPPAEQAEAVGRIPPHKRMAQGEAVFMINWNNRLQYMRNDVGEALPSIGIAPVPAAEPGLERASNIGTWGWIVPQASDAATPAAQARHARALRFVEEVSSKEAVAFLSRQTGIIPARRDVAIPESIGPALHSDVINALNEAMNSDTPGSGTFRFQDRGPTFVHGFVRDAIQDVLTCWSNVTKPLPTGLIGDCARYFEECVESNAPGTDCIQRAIRQRLEAAERDIRAAAHRSLL